MRSSFCEQFFCSDKENREVNPVGLTSGLTQYERKNCRKNRFVFGSLMLMQIETDTLDLHKNEIASQVVILVIRELLIQSMQKHTMTEEQQLRRRQPCYNASVYYKSNKRV